MTEQEKNEFVNSSDISFKEIDKNSSIKTNQLITDRNFTLLKGYLKKLKDYSIYINNLIDIDSIISKIINQYQSSKNVLIISQLLNINDSSTQKVNGINYKVTRIDDYIIEIINLNDSEWLTDNLIVQIKNNNGIIVYPTIFTINNKIIIHFIDGILTDYKIFFI